MKRRTVKGGKKHPFLYGLTAGNNCEKGGVGNAQIKNMTLFFSVGLAVSR